MGFNSAFKGLSHFCILQMAPLLTRVHKDIHFKQHYNFHTLSHNNVAIQAWLLKAPEHSVRRLSVDTSLPTKEAFSLTGWSASSSEPYIKTRWALSRSEILRGNHGISPKSEKKETCFGCDKEHFIEIKTNPEVQHTWRRPGPKKWAGTTASDKIHTLGTKN